MAAKTMEYLRLCLEKRRKRDHPTKSQIDGKTTASRTQTHIDVDIYDQNIIR